MAIRIEYTSVRTYSRRVCRSLFSIQNFTKTSVSVTLCCVVTLWRTDNQQFRPCRTVQKSRRKLKLVWRSWIKGWWSFLICLRQLAGIVIRFAPTGCTSYSPLIIKIYKNCFLRDCTCIVQSFWSLRNRI